MRENPTALSVSPSGVLLVSGFASSLRIERGALVARSGSGRDIREAIIPKVQRPRLRRLVVLGRGGFMTFDVFDWLRGVGASFLHIGNDGQVLAASGFEGPDQPALRRAAALAAGNGAGFDVARFLLVEKLAGQLTVSRAHFPEHDGVEAGLVRALDGAKASRDVRGLLAWEAKGAASYWPAWVDSPVRFGRGDVPKLPPHWLSFGERHSPLSSSARYAVTPGGAILHLMYGLAAFEARLALLAIGLDPGIAWAHKDLPYRDSAVFDVIEAVRPRVDAFALDLFDQRTFTRRDFVETPTGQVRVAPSLVRLLAASTLSRWESAVGPATEEVVRIIAASATPPVTVRTRLTQSDRKRGRKSPGSTTRASKLPPSCRMCGVVLGDPERVICDDCLPAYDAERTAKLAAAGRSTLATLRASADDPAQSADARARRAETSRTRTLAIRAWEREHGRVRDQLRYDTEIVLAIQQLSVANLMAITGLSQHHLWQVRSGRKRLHAMHWEGVLAMVEGRGRASD